MNTYFEQAGWVDARSDGPESQIGEGLQLAIGRLLDEWPGVIFGLITLWYVVASIAKLA